MLTKIVAYFFGLLLWANPTLAQEFPEAAIQNEHLQAILYLPDTEEGYYRSTRFDWSGVIGSLQYQGHEYFGNWLAQHSPTNPESISGPVEAFAPIGFEKAEVGEDFLIIGVGMLHKPDKEPYHFMTSYEITDPGQWKVQTEDKQVTFIQELHSEDGYAYEYTKTVRLVPGQPTLVLEHQLKNTGRKTLETTVYNHNFFIIDKEPTGPNIVTKFPFSVQAEGKGFGEVIVAQDSTLFFERTLDAKENVYTPDLRGFGSEAEDYDIRIENTKTGAGVHITANQPLLKFVYWACATTACPEPYLQVKAAPGEVFSWNIQYDFYTFSPNSDNGE